MILTGTPHTKAGSDPGFYHVMKRGRFVHTIGVEEKI